MVNYLDEFIAFEKKEVILAESKRILIEDGLNIFIRHFQANPALNENGEHIGGVLGFFRDLNKMIVEYRPHQIIIAFDGKGGSSKRKKIYPEYKEGRSLARSLNRPSSVTGLIDEQESMKKQLATIISCLDYLPVTTISVDGIEADDCIASCVKQLLPSNYMKIIISSDKDFLQLIDTNTCVYQPHKKILITESNMHETYGYTPHNYLTMRCFDGDRSDNINGVLHVGPKTLDKYFNLNSKEDITLEKIFLECEEKALSKTKIYSNITSQKHIAERNYQLMQLQDTAISIDSARSVRRLLEHAVPDFNRFKLSEILSKCGLANMLRELLAWSDAR